MNAKKLFLVVFVFCVETCAVRGAPCYMWTCAHELVSALQSDSKVSAQQYGEKLEKHRQLVSIKKYEVNEPNVLIPYSWKLMKQVNLAHIAVVEGRDDLLKELLERDPKLSKDKGKNVGTPTQCAVSCLRWGLENFAPEEHLIKYQRMFDMLIQAEWKSWYFNEFYKDQHREGSPYQYTKILFSAVYGAHEQFVKEILDEKKASPNSTRKIPGSFELETVLMVAFDRYYFFSMNPALQEKRDKARRVLEILMDHGAQFSPQYSLTRYKNFPDIFLICAIRNHDLMGVKLALDKNADPNVLIHEMPAVAYAKRDYDNSKNTDSDRETIFTIITLLLTKSGNPNTVNNDSIRGLSHFLE